MKIQTVSKYLTLAKEGLVPKLDCPIDQGLLFCNQDLEDNIFLYCISCSYKKNIGTHMYDRMKKVLDGVNK
ncbi:MAG: hypothetical protein ACO3CQ_01530 [Candidatus Nanopelagicaceae bacterium]